MTHRWMNWSQTRPLVSVIRTGTALRLLSIATLGFVSGCIGGTRPITLRADTVPLQVEEKTLDSGLRIVIERSPNRALAGVVLLIHSGARWDPPGKEGLSHLVEHLVFRERGESGGSLYARLSAAGAATNGATDFDLNWYHAFARAEQLPELLSMISEVITDPLQNVTDADFRQEQAIVQAERGNRQDDVPGQLDTWLAKSMLLEGQPSARAGGGSKESIDALNLEDARTFARRFYRPERMTLYVRVPAATLKSDAVLARLDPLRGAVSRGTKKVAPYVPPEPHPGRLRKPGELIRTRLSVSSPEVWLSWPIPYQTLDQRAQAEAIAQIANSAIFPNFHSEASIAGASCQLRRFLDTPALLCNMVLKDAESAELAIRDAIDGMRRGMQWGPYSAAGFDWLTRRFNLWQVLDDEYPLASAERIAYGAHVHGKASDNRDLALAMRRLDAETVLEQGRALLRREHGYGLLVTPYAGTEGVGLDVESDSADSASTDSGAALKEAPLPQVWPVGRNLVNFSLANGLVVQLLQNPDTRYVTATLGFRGGSAWAPTAQIGKAMERGEVGALPRDPIDDGVELIRKRWPDAQLETVRSLDSNLDKVIEVLATAREPVVEWPNLRFRRVLSSHIANDFAPEHKALDRHFKALFGTHRYAEHAFAEDVDHVQKPAISAYIGALRRPDNAALVVVGNIDAEELRSAVERHFGDWETPKREKIHPPAAVDPVPNAGPTPEVLITHHPASEQTQIDWSCLLPVSSGRESARANLVQAAVRIRLSDALRERTQVAYSVSGDLAITASKYARVYWSTQVANHQLVAALRTIFQTPMDREQRGWEETLRSAKHELLSGIALSMTTTAAIADQVMRYWIFGWDLSDVQRHPTLISQTTTGEFVGLLDTCFSRLKLSIVGDESAAATAVVRAREESSPPSRVSETRKRSVND